MSKGTVTCPRCNEGVNELRFVPPDLLTKDIIEEVESHDQDLTDDDGWRYAATVWPTSMAIEHERTGLDRVRTLH